MSALACPNCGAELDIATLFAHEADSRALARLAAVSIPLGARVLQYVALFTPARQRLTARKKIKLLLELLPDLERRAITHKGRDWPAPLAAWAEAIDQMLALRDAGRLDLPMKGHKYLYAILTTAADKAEAAGEKERESTRRATRNAGAHGGARSVLDAMTPLRGMTSAGAVDDEMTGAGHGAAVMEAAPGGEVMRAPARSHSSSPTVRAMREAVRRAQAAQAAVDDITNPKPEGEPQ